MDASGAARFTTIYPGWYAGRATHIHIEVFVDNRSVKTSPIAFPEEINSAVYATGVYASKGQNPTKDDRDASFGWLHVGAGNGDGQSHQRLQRDVPGRHHGGSRVTAH